MYERLDLLEVSPKCENSKRGARKELASLSTWVKKRASVSLKVQHKETALEIVVGFYLFVGLFLND